MGEQVAVPDYNTVWANVYGDMQHAGPVHRHMKRIASGLLAPLDYASILDVGCGPGDNIPMLSRGRQLKRITGTDISTWAIEQARAKFPDGDFHAFDIEQEKLDGQWDLVYSSLLLEHLPDDVAALRNLRAMTGKYLLITTIAGNFERYKAWDIRMGHVRNYQVGELEEKMRGAGFTVQEAVYWGFPFYTPFARTLQNRSSMGTGKFGLPARMAAEAMYRLYYLNSRKRGDLLVMLATV
ncbi:MAG: class I SAM-dependent methyltransferase [Chloroflexota bacterium]|nr:class I SAM-dependent methyltransferase [Chloroflexota bacterium]